MRVIIDERKLGEKLTLGVQAEGDEVGIFLASEDVSASCAFLPEEWKRFVEAIREADAQIHTRL